MFCHYMPLYVACLCGIHAKTGMGPGWVIGVYVNIIKLIVVFVHAYRCSPDKCSQ